MKQRRNKTAMPVLDLLEEAVQLLRLAPVGTILLYYIGSLPFWIGFLFFWGEMSRSAFAHERCAPLAGGVALLFLWMKTAQMLFAGRLREQLMAHSVERPTWRELLAAAASQSFLQATGFVILPVALVLTIPAAWGIAFYQNATALGVVRSGQGETGIRQVIRQTVRWPAQNHLVLLLLFGFGCVVLVNVASVLLAGPYLLKTLLGVETAATQSWVAMLNTTFFAAVFVLSWLCVDPLLKAVYVLRCFYGQAVNDGEDLRAELRMVRRRRGLMPVAAIIVLLGATPVSGADGEDVSLLKAATTVVPGADLDQAIDETLERREFAWRMPREELPGAETSGNWLTEMIDRSLEWTGKNLKALFKSAFDFIRWLFEKLFDVDQPQQAAGSGWLNAMRGLFILLICALVAVLGYLLWRLWMNHRNRAPAVVGEAALPVPDLEDHGVTAADLPETEWLRLAREMIAKGEYRLALRAFYLAGLAHLSERGLLTIERYKSNLDYQRELDRKGHALPQIVGAFSANVLAFDRVWYGRHEATTVLLDEFEGNLKRICET